MQSLPCFKRNVLCLLFFFFSTVSSSGIIGVIYSANITGTPEPKAVVAKLRQRNIPRVRLIEADAKSISAFVGSGILINLHLKSEIMVAMAADQSFAHDWLLANVKPYFPGANITSISLGYQVLTNHPETEWGLILPAISNVQTAWARLGLPPIPISTAHNFQVVVKPYPPSAAEFNGTIAEKYMKPLLKQLSAANSTFMIDLFPFQLKIKASGPTDRMKKFEGRQSEFLVDPVTNYEYTNFFDIMVDATYSAMEKMGFSHIPVIVAGTGWPSASDMRDPMASLQNAAEYNSRLVMTLNEGKGTPMRPHVTPETYIYSLYDDPRKRTWEAWQHDFGIWNSGPDSKVKYPLEFTAIKSAGGEGKEGTLSKWLQFVFSSSAWVFFFCFF